MIRSYQKEIPKITSTPSVHCEADRDGFKCLMHHSKLVTKLFGPERALIDIKEMYEYKPSVVAGCHQLTHVVGNTAVDLYQGDINEAFAHGDSFCWSGYYHGVVERAVSDLGKEKFISSADTVCNKVNDKDRYGFNYFNCVHGLGHGLMAFSDNELFEALPLCDKLSGNWEQRSCYGGVFMENVMEDNRNHDSKYLKKNDLMYPCNAVAYPYKEQCYLMQTSYALAQNNYDFHSGFELCAKAEEGFRDICAQSMGRDASGHSVSDVVRTNAYCALALDDNQRTNCLIGAVKDFISFFHGGEQAKKLCEAVPERFTEGCLSVRESYLKTL